LGKGLYIGDTQADLVLISYFYALSVLLPGLLRTDPRFSGLWQRRWKLRPSTYYPVLFNLVAWTKYLYRGDTRGSHFLISYFYALSVLLPGLFGMTPGSLARDSTDGGLARAGRFYIFGQW
jgi:hypothetical protein